MFLSSREFSNRVVATYVSETADMHVHDMHALVSHTRTLTSSHPILARSTSCTDISGAGLQKQDSLCNNGLAQLQIKYPGNGALGTHVLRAVRYRDPCKCNSTSSGCNLSRTKTHLWPTAILINTTGSLHSLHRTTQCRKATDIAVASPDEKT